MKWFFAAFLVSLFTVSCVSNSPSWEEAAVKVQAERYQQAKLASQQLTHGIIRNEALKILGKPDKIEGSICGGNSQAGPWMCVIWTYTFVHGVTAPFVATSQLVLTFQKADNENEWSLNSWNWYQ